MLLTVKAKLQPTDEQRRKLLNTMETFNRACDDISKEAYEKRRDELKDRLKNLA